MYCNSQRIKFSKKKNASIQDRKFQCRMDQMQVSHVDKDMVEQSHTTPSSICEEYLNHPLGLTLSTPGLVFTYLLTFFVEFFFSEKTRKKVFNFFGNRGGVSPKLKNFNLFCLFFTEGFPQPKLNFVSLNFCLATFSFFFHFLFKFIFF